MLNTLTNQQKRHMRSLAKRILASHIHMSKTSERITKLLKNSQISVRNLGDPRSTHPVRKEVLRLEGILNSQNREKQKHVNEFLNKYNAFSNRTLNNLIRSLNASLQGA